MDQVVSARKKRSGLPENILGRVSRREGMAVLPHLKRLKNSPQASAPLCLIENPAFRHLHNCFSHSKLPHLDEKYKRLTFPGAFTESLDLKPDFSEGGLKRRNSYPKTRTSTAENGCSNLHSVAEKTEMLQCQSNKGHSIRGSISEITSQNASSSAPAPDGYFLPDEDSLSASEADAIEGRSQWQQSSGCAEMPSAQYHCTTQGRMVSTVNDDTLQARNHTNDSLEEPCVDIPFDKLRRVSSHVSSKSSLQSITE